MFDHCVVRNAYDGIQSKGCLTLRSTTIRKGERIGLGVGKSGVVYANRVTIRELGGQVNSMGINLLGNAYLRFDSSTVDSVYWGALVYGNAVMEATKSAFTNGYSDAVRVSQNATIVARDCEVSSIGSNAILFVNTASGVIDDWEITGGTSGVRAETTLMARPSQTTRLTAALSV